MAAAHATPHPRKMVVPPKVGGLITPCTLRHPPWMLGFDGQIIQRTKSTKQLKILRLGFATKINKSLLEIEVIRVSRE